MDDVTPRSLTGRPRIVAVGAIFALCLVGAPIMSLFPIGVWSIVRALTLSDAGLSALLLTPVAVGGILLMWSLSRRWLLGAGAEHPNSTSALVVGTAMVVPVVLALLTPMIAPMAAGTAPLSALVAAVVTTVAMGVCVPTFRSSTYRRMGVLPGLVVVIVALAALPSFAEHLRDRQADQRSLTQVREFEDPIVVLDHEGWVPVSVYEVWEGLRVTYALAGTDETRGVYVVSWSEERREEGVRAECDLSGVRCVKDDSLLTVYRGAAAEVRVELPDGTIASVRPVGSVGADELRTVARSLRLEEDDERCVLAHSVMDG